MLDTLVAEVVEHIVGSLDDKRDLFAVRLVCRQLCLKSFTVFAIRWFNTISSDLSQRSLYRLESIARHEALRLFVCHLRIGEGSRPRPAGRPLGWGIHWYREKLGCLDASAVIVAIFRDWLVNKFVRCRSFEITDTCGNYTEQEGTLTSLSPADAIQLLFAATTGLPVHTFRIHLIRSPSYLYPSQISRGVVNSIQFQGAWAASLLELELACTLQNNDILGIVRDLITTAKNLRRLKLSFRWSDVTDQLLDSLGQATSLGPINDLKLSFSGSITQRTLLSFLSRLDGSLKSLTLSHVYLSAGSWRSIFGDLQSRLPNLERLTYSRCTENPAHGYTFFCPLRQNPTVQGDGGFQFWENTWKGKRRLQGVRYTGQGPNMRRALDALEVSVYTIYRDGPPSPGYSDQGAVRKFDPRDSDY